VWGQKERLCCSGHIDGVGWAGRVTYLSSPQRPCKEVGMREGDHSGWGGTLDGGGAAVASLMWGQGQQRL
jgi:hypothetical protein